MKNDQTTPAAASAGVATGGHIPGYRPVVLVGHRHMCPVHGIGTVVTGDPDVKVYGRPVARLGDQISCGCVIITASKVATIHGRRIARKGDKTHHPGTPVVGELIEGFDPWIVE